MVEPSVLGLTGQELSQRTLGDYEFDAIGQNGKRFLLELTVTSDALNVEQQHPRQTTGVCPSALELEAQFSLTSADGALGGAWAGVLRAERPPGVANSPATDLLIRGSARPQRAQLSALPHETEATLFAFGVTFGTDGLSGMLTEAVDEVPSAMDGATLSEPSVIARWGKYE